MATNETDSKFPVPGVESDALKVAETSVPGGVDPAELFQPKNTPQDQANTNLKDAVEAVFNTLDMTVKSVLDTKHIIALARGRIFAQRYNSPMMAMLCDELLQMRVSLKGRGRKDLVATLQSAMRADTPGDSEEIKARKLFGSG